MALGLKTLLMVGVASVGCATATYLLPAVVADAQTAPAAVAQAAAAPAAPQQAVAVAKADPIECNAQSWPYVSSECQAKQAALRQVRVISTDKGAPRIVPLPASMQAAAEPAQPIATASLTTDLPASDGAVLPPARPADLGGDQAAAAPQATAQAGDIDATGSVVPAPDAVASEKAARKAAQAKRRVARARQRLEDGAGVDGRYASADIDPQSQATVYRYADGREVIVRPESRDGYRRRYADQGADVMPHYYPSQQRQQPSGGLLGMLFGN